MKAPRSASPSSANGIAATAAGWVMRQDRGLSPEEQDHFLQWLAADTRHAEAMTRLRRTWGAFDRLAGLQASVQAVPDPDLLAPNARRTMGRGWKQVAWVSLPLAAAAAIAVLFWPAGPHSTQPPGAVTNVAVPVAPLPPIEERLLDDGSVIRLNRGAVLAVEYSPAERRVRLDRGEAAFDVARHVARPFVVVADGVAVRAVGTAFNVRRADQAIEVIVTQGSVAVTGGGAIAAAALPGLVAGQRAVVPLTPADGAPAVGTLSADELARRLAWQPRLLSFTDEPLEAILNEFNRHNPITLRIDGPVLRELRLTARFRSDNVDGFLRLLASDFGVRADRGSGAEILLRATR